MLLVVEAAEEVDKEEEVGITWVLDLEVVGGGCQTEVVGGGGGGFVVVGGGASVPSVNSHSPYMIPIDWGAKNENRPGLRSSPPHGHPGHVSSTVAVVVLPP